MRAPGTWRRLKIASEVKAGHGVPVSLPDEELLRLLGLLCGIRDGQAAMVLDADAEQLRRGRAEAAKLSAEGVREACARLAREVDVKKFL